MYIYMWSSKPTVSPNERLLGAKKKPIEAPRAWVLGSLRLIIPGAWHTNHIGGGGFFSRKTPFGLSRYTFMPHTFTSILRKGKPRGNQKSSLALWTKMTLGTIALRIRDNRVNFELTYLDLYRLNHIETLFLASGNMLATGKRTISKIPPNAGTSGASRRKKGTFIPMQRGFMSGPISLDTLLSRNPTR